MEKQCTCSALKGEKMNSDDFIIWLRGRSERSGLRKILMYENISLWWFCDFELYYLFKKHLRGESTLHRNKHLLVYKSLKYYQIFKPIIRSLIGKLLCKTNYKKSNKYKILAVSYTNYWNLYPTPQHLKGTKEVDLDCMIGNVITLLKNRDFNVVALDQDVNFFIDFKVLVEKIIQIKNTWKPVESYLTLNCIKQALKLTKKYKIKWNNLKKDVTFTNAWKYKDIELRDVLIRYFDRFFEQGIFLPILYLELLRRVIKIEQPDAIVITCGYCLLGEVAMIVSNLKKIPTLEIQHGVIHPAHIAYIFTKGDKKDCPIPNKTAVCGQYHYDLLTKNSIYEPDQVVVTGQPRYDVLFYADKIYSKERFFTEYKINPEHKIVLWTTQCHSLSEEENNKNFKAVFKTMQNLKDTTLIIKQHPGEREEDTKMIEEFLSKYEISAVVTPKSSDTYEQLFVCDLMTTQASTTAMEAVALNKPVVILNLSGEPDIVEYVKEGVALGVYKEEDLEPAIVGLLKDDSELAKNREKYIEKYLYKIDGKATERVVGVIEGMIKEGRKRGEK